MFAPSGFGKGFVARAFFKEIGSSYMTENNPWHLYLLLLKGHYRFLGKFLLLASLLVLVRLLLL